MDSQLEILTALIKEGEALPFPIFVIQPSGGRIMLDWQVRVHLRGSNGQLERLI
jgi:hypothetical protein